MPDAPNRARPRLGYWVVVICALTLLLAALITIVAAYFLYQKARQPGVVLVPGQGRSPAGAAAPLKVNAPDWAPVYPGAADLRQGPAFDSPEGAAGSFHFTTSDPVAKVARYYEGRMQAAGFKLNRLGEYEEAMTSAILLFEHEDGKRNLTVNLQSGDSGTEAQVQFGVKK